MKRETKIGDYIEPGYTGHYAFMPTDIYSAALDAIVFACVDIFATYAGKVVIAKRARHPQTDWWIFGGRMRTGESINESARRLLSEEVGINVDVSRFKYLTTFVAAWRTRAHEPVLNGTHNVSITVIIDLLPDEYAAISLNDEYTEWKLLGVDKLFDSTVYHPALGQCAGAYNESMI